MEASLPNHLYTYVVVANDSNGNLEQNLRCDRQFLEMKALHGPWTSRSSRICSCCWLELDGIEREAFIQLESGCLPRCLSLGRGVAYIHPMHLPCFRHIVVRSSRPAPSQALSGFSGTTTQRQPQNSFLEIPLLVAEKPNCQCELSGLARTSMTCYQILNTILYLKNVRFGNSSSVICGVATGALNIVKLAHLRGRYNIES